MVGFWIIPITPIVVYFCTGFRLHTIKVCVLFNDINSEFAQKLIYISHQNADRQFVKFCEYNDKASE